MSANLNFYVNQYCVDPNALYFYITADENDHTPINKRLITLYSFLEAKRLMDLTHSWNKASNKRTTLYMFKEGDILPENKGMIGVERAGYSKPTMLYIS